MKAESNDPRGYLKLKLGVGGGRGGLDIYSPQLFSEVASQLGIGNFQILSYGLGSREVPARPPLFYSKQRNSQKKCSHEVGRRGCLPT